MKEKRRKIHNFPKKWSFYWLGMSFRRWKNYLKRRKEDKKTKKKRNNELIEHIFQKWKIIIKEERKWKHLLISFKSLNMIY